ncbi:hypothetical protein BV20DRAFT_984170 [Pilatotrama ljubarskyi]|nr:hypothetical protein BV20DRAFT_984170 [Pilatotrama ljubarskyi]
MYRRHTLFTGRVATLRELGLYNHLILLHRISVRGMSDDEADVHEGRSVFTYRIIRSAWQSLALRTFLRMIDVLHTETWQRANPRTLRWTSPRIRYESGESRVEEGRPPIGLWRNCYDATWLAGLTPEQVLELDIVDEDYDFSFTLPPRM